MVLERHPFERRWSKDIIRLCLTRGYAELKNSNFMILPSQNLLRKYKNSIHQEAGINIDMLAWMSNEAMIIKGVLYLTKCQYNLTCNSEKEIVM
jgi:hypothetical protein